MADPAVEVFPHPARWIHRHAAFEARAAARLAHDDELSEEDKMARVMAIWSAFFERALGGGGGGGGATASTDRRLQVSGGSHARSTADSWYGSAEDTWHWGDHQLAGNASTTTYDATYDDSRWYYDDSAEAWWYYDDATQAWTPYSDGVTYDVSDPASSAWGDSAEAEWVRMTDDASGHEYWYNAWTGESVWVDSV